MTEVAAWYESSTSFDLPMFAHGSMVRGSWIVFCDIFSKSFSGVYDWKTLSAYLVISSGNSHLLSSALEMILTVFGTTESSSLLSDAEEELDDSHGE